MNIDFKKIKLIIWDLDETFWKGILSDHTVEFNTKNAKLVKDMTDAGVINSICSKNDLQEVEKVLKEHNIWDFFVFKSINWTAKGNRVKQIIHEMNLRAANVLFIDDNETNLHEVQSICEGIMISNVEIIPELCKYFDEIEKKDTLNKRLNQYKILEKKKDFKATIGSNEEFLKQCNIQVEFYEDCLSETERISDLILRSNQLNFTKIRSNITELENTIKDKGVQSGYIKVHDNFGDYGIVGFYAIKDNTLIHFVFSCRTLNMGVEQYVYHKLGCPKLDIIGEVSSSLEGDIPDWINNNSDNKSFDKKEIKSKKTLIKGPCDLEVVFSFIKNSKNIIKEFVYVSDKGVSIEQGNHTVHILESQSLDNQTKDRLCKELPFGDKGMFETKMFDKDISLVIYSLFTDPNLGLYQDKSGAIVAFGEYTNDLTDKKRWNEYINKEVFVANCNFTEENLLSFSQNYKFIGRITPDQILCNIDKIYNLLASKTVLVLTLGSETPHEGNTQPAYADRHIYNKELNEKIRNWAKDKPRVVLMDFNNYIDGQDSFTNNINHFSKKIYFNVAQELIKIIEEKSEENVLLNSKFEQEVNKYKKIFKEKIKKIFKNHNN